MFYSQVDQKSSMPLVLSSHQRRPQLSLLNVPELLQLVFSFLDDHTLRTVAILVCRKWFFLNYHRLGRKVTWDLQWQPSQPKQALARLPGAERLVLFCVNDHQWNGPDLHAALSALQKSTNTLWSTLAHLLRFQEPQLIEKQLHRPLREFVLKTGYSFQDSWLNRLPFPPSLTTLNVEKSQTMLIDVERILVICPLLETLHVSSSVFLTFREPRASQRKLIPTLPDRLPLRSLVLKHPHVAQSRMEDLLARMPNLEVLKLIELTQMSDNVWDWPRFRKYIQSLYLPLKRFHYSIQLMRSIDKEQEEEIAAVCPNAKEPTLSLHGLTPKVIKSLTTQYIVLTTLEILLNGNALCQGDGWVLNFRDVEPRYTARPLHHLLCEGSTLRHLKTLKIPYLVDFMDLHRRYTHFMTYEEIQSLSTLNVPGIWSCRGLSTLHIELHCHMFESLNDDHFIRITCGYVSRVCPRLMDLNIAYPKKCRRPRTTVSIPLNSPFKLRAGICLLSRLKRLERLRLDFSQIGCEESELTWLCPSGRTPRKNLQRLSSIVKQWTCLLEDEVIQEAKQQERISAGADMTIIGEGAEDVELMDSLQNLGLLLDVKVMVEEMNSIDFLCLPELRRLACGRHLEQSPEKEMSSVFYVKPGQPPGLLSLLSLLSLF